MALDAAPLETVLVLKGTPLAANTTEPVALVEMVALKVTFAR